MSVFDFIARKAEQRARQVAGFDEPRHCQTDPAVDDHLPPFLRAECFAEPADHDWPDHDSFVDADAYERTFARGARPSAAPTATPSGPPPAGA